MFCPAAPTPIASPNSQPVSVTYSAPISTNGAPPVTISCSRESGSTFPIGTTAVTCTATDSRQRTDACTFNVVVLPTPRVSVTGFVAFGDSITYGEDGRASLVAFAAPGQLRPRVQFPPSLTYPGVLQQLLRGRYSNQTPTVSNAGVPEEKAGRATTLARFLSVSSNSAFEAVLLMEGTNDIFERDAGEIPATIANLRRMVQAARGRNQRVYLATIPPMVPGTQRGLAWSLVPVVNEQIRNVAASEGATLVDVEQAFGTAFEPFIGFDGLHPSEAGYAKIADTFFTAIKATLDTTPTTTATGVAPRVVLPGPAVRRLPGR